jgi:hypothetical protein
MFFFGCFLPSEAVVVVVVVVVVGATTAEETPFMMVDVPWV